MLQNGTVAEFGTPYRNVYGEYANKKNDRWAQYKLDHNVLGDIRKRFMEFKIQDIIV